MTLDLNKPDKGAAFIALRAEAHSNLALTKSNKGESSEFGSSTEIHRI